MPAVVFFGSPDFALPALEALIHTEYRPVLVVTQPDRPSGRGMAATPTPVNRRAGEAGIAVRTTGDLRNDEMTEYLQSFKPDFFVVVAFGKIFPGRILGIPSRECINVHASLLPAYRGASPVNMAVVGGDSFTGVSTIRMTEKLDAGPVFMQDVEPIDPMEDAGSLSGRLARRGAGLLLRTLRAIDDEGLVPLDQPGEGISSAPLLRKKDGLVPWHKTVFKVHDHIRGMNPWPGSHTYVRGKYIKIYKAQPAGTISSGRAPGEVIAADGDDILVACGAGTIRINKLQAEGKKPHDAGDFLRGFELGAGERFGEME